VNADESICYIVDGTFCAISAVICAKSNHNLSLKL
jgi:hypothetical protein